jgi:hypothetical protein
MDQDVLTALLALYHVTKSRDHYSIPGIEVVRKGAKENEKGFDFLSVFDQKICDGECKSGPELGEKDFQAARFAADFGVEEFYFCTVRYFSTKTIQKLDEFEKEIQEVSRMTIKRLSCIELVGDEYS